MQVRPRHIHHERRHPDLLQRRERQRGQRGRPSPVQLWRLLYRLVCCAGRRRRRRARTRPKPGRTRCATRRMCGRCRRERVSVSVWGVRACRPETHLVSFDCGTLLTSMTRMRDLRPSRDMVQGWTCHGWPCGCQRQRQLVRKLRCSSLFFFEERHFTRWRRALPTPTARTRNQR